MLSGIALLKSPGASLHAPSEKGEAARRQLWALRGAFPEALLRCFDSFIERGNHCARMISGPVVPAPVGAGRRPVRGLHARPGMKDMPTHRLAAGAHGENQEVSGKPLPRLCSRSLRTETLSDFSAAPRCKSRAPDRTYTLRTSFCPVCRPESASHWAQTFCRPFGTCMSRGAFPGVRGLTPGCSLAPLAGLWAWRDRWCVEWTGAQSQGDGRIQPRVSLRTRGSAERWNQALQGRQNA